MKQLQPKYSIAIGIILLILVIWGYYQYQKSSEYSAHRDIREEGCRGKTITSIEYNTLEKQCFETTISACEKPTFSSLKSCQEINGVQETEED